MRRRCGDANTGRAGSQSCSRCGIFAVARIPFRLNGLIETTRTRRLESRGCSDTIFTVSRRCLLATTGSYLLQLDRTQ